MNGPCAKTQVRCTIISPLGRWVGENFCQNPQRVCPREQGEGYEKCQSICDQVGHAEVVAVSKAGDAAYMGTAYIEGHTYACGNCQKALGRAGVNRIVISAPPE